MKVIIDTMYTKIDFGTNTLLQEKVRDIMHYEMGVKQDGAFFSKAYKSGYWDGIIDFYNMKEDKFHTGLLHQFFSGIRKLQEKDPTITYEIEDTRPPQLVHPDSIDEKITLQNGDSDPIVMIPDDYTRGYQYKAVQQVFREQVGIVNVSTGGGKCLSKDTRILTVDGYKTVEHIFQQNGTPCEDKEQVVIANNLVLINRYGKPEKASHLTFNGRRKLKKLVTDTGLVEKVTYNHPLLTVNEQGDFEWKKAEDIQVGDKLVTRIGDNVYGTDSCMDESDAYLRGTALAQNGGRGARREIPRGILQAPKRVQQAFLSGYLEYAQPRLTDSGKLSVSSKSQKLLSQIQLMLKNMGVLSTLRNNCLCIEPERENKSTNNLFFDKVVSIEDIGEEPTFDVCMPETHSFIAESIVNHNTEIAAAVMQQVMPYLKSEERIAFFCGSKEIFNQSAERIAKRLGLREKDIGKIGDGKFDIKNKKIVFVMIPTLVSALKDPKKGLKFTHKENVIKFIAEQVAPKFLNTVNTRHLLRNYIKNCKLTTKIWQSAEEQLMYIAYDNKFTDKSAQMQLRRYMAEFDKIMEKKNSKKYSRYKDTVEFMKSVRVMIADECLVGDTLVLKEDGGWSYIKDIHNGQVIKGGVVSDVFTRESAITSVKSKHTLLEGSPTHPTFVVRKEDIGLYKKGIKQIEDFEQTPLMNIKEGDYIPVLVKIPHVEKTQWTPEQLSFVAMIMADGHLDKDSITSDGRVKRSNRVKVNVTKDKEWYLEEFIKGAKSFNPNIEVKHNYDCRGNLTIWVNDEGLKDTLENVFDIPRGKKSDKIRINEQIQYAPMESIKAFIRTYFSCEGDISRSKQGENPSYRIHACTVSKEFSQGMSLLLKKFGIIANMQIIKRKKDNHNVVYRIGLGGFMYNQFMDVIGVMERKSNSQRNAGLDPLIYVGDYVLSKVKEVDHIEVVQPVYDFTTTTHTFIANGALTHNCHHGKADTWFTSLSLCENATIRVGLTGTVDTKDKMGWQRLQALFNQIIIKISNEYLIERGVSSTPTIRVIPIRDPRDIELVNNYQEAYKKGIVENDVRNEVVAKLAFAYKKQRQGGILISVKEIEHGEKILSLLKDYGLDAEFIHGSSPDEHRTGMLDKFAKGKLDILVASTIIDEGIDVKSIGCMILAAGGKSMRQLLQRIGRGLRLNGIDGNKVLIFDFYDETNIYLKNHSNERIKIFKNENFNVKVIGQ